MKRTLLSLLQLVNDSAYFSVNGDIYYWGVAQAVNETENQTVTVYFSGDDCPHGQPIWNGVACEEPPVLTNHTTTNTTIEVNEVTFFTFVVPNAAKNFAVTITTTDPNAQFESYARAAGTPSAALYDVKGTTTLTLSVPPPGTWYASVKLTAATVDAPVDVLVSYSTFSCGEKLGSICNDTVIATSASAIATGHFKFGGPLVYFSVQTDPLYVSFQSSSLDIPIFVYASIGNLPSPASHLLSGCNQPNCKSVTIIKLDNSSNLTGNETWYFGVAGGNDTTIGVWVSSTCAPLCESPSGECTETGPDTGLCECEQDYIGFECQTATGLPSQYIVLIIIATLVVASAVIGFIAWAYMRRKRAHYEKVV